MIEESLLFSPNYTVTFVQKENEWHKFFLQIYWVEVLMKLFIFWNPWNPFLPQINSHFDYRRFARKTLPDTAFIFCKRVKLWFFHDANDNVVKFGKNFEWIHFLHVLGYLFIQDQILFLKANNFKPSLLKQD